MLRPFALAGLTLFAMTANAQDMPQAKVYRDCTALAKSEPAAGVENATAWREQGGGVAAEHCLAIALIALGQHEQGALVLERALDHIRAGRGIADIGMRITPALLAALYGQAGNARLLADRPDLAYQHFSTALTQLDAGDPAATELLIDRARASAEAEDYEAALKDLDHAQLLAPERGEIYLFRATARRYLGDFDAGLSDADQALRLGEDRAAVELERGNLFFTRGDIDQARLAWLAASQAESDGPNGDAARKNLGSLEWNGQEKP